jgi:nitrite reductase (NADH) small subunit
MPEFVKVASIKEIPKNTAKACEIGDHHIAVFNVVDKSGSEFCAINNLCPHRGGPLAEGDLKGTLVTCPWHNWEFDVKTGANPVNPAVSVKTFPCKVEGEDVLVAVGD